MPFTPFHLGPALLLGLLFALNLPVLLVASVILDIEPFYSMFINDLGYLHGPFHTYLAATFIGIGLALASGKFGIPFKKAIYASLMGVYSHIFLDSFLYQDIKPFYPFQANPFYMVISSIDIYSFSALAFLPAFIIIIYKTRSRAQL